MKEYADDREMVNAILSGNRRAFENLVRRNERLVHHILLPFLGNPADRKDVCQDVFVKVYENLHTFQFRSKLSTWIGNIAYNTAINFLEKWKKASHSDHRTNWEDDGDKDFVSDDSPLPDEILITKERSQLLARAIEQLPEIQKSILLLFHKEEISLEEIGAMLDLPVNTVKSHLFRSRRRLKDLLHQNKG